MSDENGKKDANGTTTNNHRQNHHNVYPSGRKEKDEYIDDGDELTAGKDEETSKLYTHANGHLPTTTSSSSSSSSSSSNSYSSSYSSSSLGYSRKLSSYVLALRPWSFGTSLVPVALGCALAYKTTSEFNVFVWIVTCMTAVSVHAAGNVVNTYFDYQKGIDSKKSDDRTLVDKIVTPDEMVQLGALAYGLGCFGFILLVFLSPAKMEHLALVYFGGLSSSFLYTGGIGLKYIGLGDVLVFVIFGPVTVLFAYMAQTGQMHPVTLYYAMPLALNTEAMLHVNNTRDMESDRRAGIVTLAILLGHTGSHVLFAVFLLTPYIVFAVMGLHWTPVLLLPLITIPNAFHLVKEFRRGNLRNLPRRTGKLNFYFGLFYVLACVVAGRGQLPGLILRSVWSVSNASDNYERIECSLLTRDQ